MGDTLETLHQWLQIVGKIRLRAMPWLNHSWHTSLYVSPTGYTTQSMPYAGKLFQIDFDFEHHSLQIALSGSPTESMELRPRTVASFYTELFQRLNGMGIELEIHGSPNEMEPAIPFAENTVQSSYDPDAARALWMAMLKTHNVFSEFRGQFIGKSSPVHLFWGAFDLAVTRFSGKEAPLHPGGMPNMPLEVMQEAYSREVSSAGFWPGSRDYPTPAFYAYAYPTPVEFSKQPVQPEQAFYSDELGEFLLKYEDVQRSENPERVLQSFLQSTYEAAANTLGWNRENLERSHG